MITEISGWNAAQDPGCKNLVPEVNKAFNFQIENFFKLPEDIFFVLHLIELMFKTTLDFKTGRAAITIKIGKKFSVSHGPHVTRIPLPKTVRPHPVWFKVNFCAFRKLVRPETIIGYGNPEPGKPQAKLYLKDSQGEHAINIVNITTK